MSRAVVQAVKVGETMGEEVQLVHVTLDPAEGERFRERVERQLPGVRVVLVESPYRALVRPFVRYLEVSQTEDPDRLTIVLLPEHLPRHWWEPPPVQPERAPHPGGAGRSQGLRRARYALPARGLAGNVAAIRRPAHGRSGRRAVPRRSLSRQTSIMLPGVATSMAPR